MSSNIERKGCEEEGGYIRYEKVYSCTLKTWAHLAFSLLPLDHQIQFNKISPIGPRSYHEWVNLGSRLLGLGSWHKVV